MGEKRFGGADEGRKAVHRGRETSRDTLHGGESRRTEEERSRDIDFTERGRGGEEASYSRAVTK